MFICSKILNVFTGKYGIICMEDLVHSIYTSDRVFKHASRYFWPFKVRLHESIEILFL